MNVVQNVNLMSDSQKELVDLAQIAGFLISLLLQQQVAPHSHEQYIATKLGCV